MKAVELTPHTKPDAVYLLVTAIVAFLLAMEGGSLDLKDAIILTVIFFVYVLEHYRFAKHTAKTVEHSVTKADMNRAIIMFVIGAAIIVACAERFVGAMIATAHLLNVSPMAVAIIVSPIASEMPEKITAYLTVRRDGRLAEISIANFMGSKVNHNSLLLAVLVFVSLASGQGEVKNVITYPLYFSPFVIMTVLTVFAGINLMQRRLTRRAGWTFLLMYALIIYAAFEAGISYGH